MSSQENTSANSGEVEFSAEETPAVVAEVNEPNLQAEAFDSPPPLSPYSPQPSSSSSTGRQTPGQELAHEVELANKIMYDIGDFNLALVQQIDQLLENIKSGKLGQGDGAFGGTNLIVPVTVEMMKEQAKRRKLNFEGMDAEREPKVARMVPPETEEITGSAGNQVGGNDCARKCSLHCPAVSKEDEEGGQGT